MPTRKPGRKPIQITLTEEQISEIIQQQPFVQKSLKAESLEERIAPSILGVPLIDPGLGEPPPEDPGLPPDDPALLGDEPPLEGGDVPPEGLPDDDPANLGEEPPVPPEGLPDDDPANLGEEPPVPPEGLPDDDPANLGEEPPVPPEGLPADDPANFGEEPPVPPEGLPDDDPANLGGAEPPEFLPPHLEDPNVGGDPFAPGDPTVGGDVPPHLQHNVDGGPIADQLGLAPGGDAGPDVQLENPDVGSQVDDMLRDQIEQQVSSGGAMPSPEEIEAHRENILKQLRGE